MSQGWLGLSCVGIKILLIYKKNIYIYKCIYIMTLFKIAVLPVGKEIQGFLPFDKVATRFVTCCYSTNIQ